MEQHVHSIMGICKQTKAMLFELRSQASLPGLHGFDNVCLVFKVNDEFVSTTVNIHPSGYAARRQFIDLLEQHIAVQTIEGFMVNIQNTLHPAEFQAAIIFDPDLSKYVNELAPVEQVLLKSPISKHHATCRFMACEVSEPGDLTFNGISVAFHRNLYIPDILNVDNKNSLHLFLQNPHLECKAA